MKVLALIFLYNTKMNYLTSCVVLILTLVCLYNLCISTAGTVLNYTLSGQGFIRGWGGGPQRVPKVVTLYN